MIFLYLLYIIFWVMFKIKKKYNDKYVLDCIFLKVILKKKVYGILRIGVKMCL